MAKPAQSALYPDSDYSNRREVVAHTVNYCNQVSEYEAGGTTNDVPMPAATADDWNMPLVFLTPAAQAMNALITKHSLAITPINIHTSLDYTHFLSYANSIINAANLINTGLP
jgi:hypothetical protein